MVVRGVWALAIGAVMAALVTFAAAAGQTAAPKPPVATSDGILFGEPRTVARIKIGNSPYDYFNVIACRPGRVGTVTGDSCDWKNPRSEIRRAARTFCTTKGTRDAPSVKNGLLRVGGPVAPLPGEAVDPRATTRTTAEGELSADMSNGFVSRSAGVTVFDSMTCATVTEPPNSGGINVLATASIFAAGRSAPPPGQGGVGTLPPGIKLPPGKHRVLVFSNLRGIQQYPDGVNGRLNLIGSDGISDVRMKRRRALMGVFLGPRVPSGKPPSVTTNLTSRPVIGQVFSTALQSPSGVAVEFTVPEGATRLFLGVADGVNSIGYPGGYDDNKGGFQASITVKKLSQVPLKSVSNGCGPASLSNNFTNLSTFADNAGNSFTVNFRPACDLHDAGYAGAIIVDTLNTPRHVVNFRNWTRKEVDTKFLKDLQLICRRTISTRTPNLLRKCLRSPKGASGGYTIVRLDGNRHFDADPGRKGLQPSGPRANN